MVFRILADVGIDTGLADLLRYGVIGLVCFLLIVGSMTGSIWWGRAVEAIFRAKDDRIRYLEAKFDELIVLDRDKLRLMTEQTATIAELRTSQEQVLAIARDRAERRPERK